MVWEGVMVLREVGARSRLIVTKYSQTPGIGSRGRKCEHGKSVCPSKNISLAQKIVQPSYGRGGVSSSRPVLRTTSPTIVQ